MAPWLSGLPTPWLAHSVARKGCVGLRFTLPFTQVECRPPQMCFLVKKMRRCFNVFYTMMCAAEPVMI